MIDLHTHILPGIDDGAEDLDDAAAMCRAAAANGTTVLVATPHQRHSRWSNLDRKALGQLLGQVRERIGSRPRLLLGGEIHIGPGFLEQLRDFESSGLCPLADSKYLLVEFPRRRLPFDPESVVLAIRSRGWRPIVAHPEFVPGLSTNPAIAESLVGAGALLQVTAMSVTGDFGERAESCVSELIDRDLAHFIASDSHDTDWRRPALDAAKRVVASRWDEETAVRLTTDNPRAVIENRELESRPAARVLSDLPTV